MSELKPGFSNSGAAKAVEDDEAEAKVVDSPQVEDKAVKPSMTKTKRKS